MKALEDSRNGRDLERFDSEKELFESWNALKPFFRPANSKKISSESRSEAKI